MEQLGTAGPGSHAVEALIERRFPGATVLGVRPLSDSGDDDGHKAMGYGRPLKVWVRTRDGRERALVLRTATANEYGHDRRSDRAAEMLLAFDCFNDVPRHVAALDVGGIARDGRLVSLSEVGELYLLTEYADGHMYAGELAAAARRGWAEELDVDHARLCGRYLARLHTPVEAPAYVYARAIRDLVGSGEGIFGIVDGYPPKVPAAPRSRLEAIERQSLEWRWRLKDRHRRLRRTHGDFHPFNLLFDERSELWLLDTSRGSMGDPADDLAALAINYVFFALQHPGTWRRAFEPLWDALWSSYFEERADGELLDVIAPFLAWRALVLSSPRWYPDLEPSARDALLTLAEWALATERFALESAAALLAGEAMH